MKILLSNAHGGALVIWVVRSGLRDTVHKSGILHVKKAPWSKGAFQVHNSGQITVTCMPRPNPPPPITRPTIHAFHLSDSDKRDLARILARESLPLEAAEAISVAISVYKATEAGAADTTIGNAVAALIELTHPAGRGYKRAVRRMSDDASGVDDTTLAMLQPLAKAVLAGKPEATKLLSRAARARAAELQNHDRVSPRTESLRFFCGVLREIFKNWAEPAPDEAWHRCGKFALEVLTIAGVETAKFIAHPERLKEYLGTDVP
jgi:hypothetical protein